jgi:AraC-like DNA-binding protein
MKPLLRKILATPDSSFSLNEYQLPYFDVPWHAHPEFEIILVNASSGMRYVGDSTEPFETGDLALLGAHLPHCWLNEHAANHRGTHYMTVDFRYDFLGHEFFQQPERMGVNALLRRAAQGLVFEGPEKQHLAQAVRALFQLSALERLLKLLDILRLMAQAAQARQLSSAGFLRTAQLGEDQHIDRVHRYVMAYFKQPITLEAVAKIAGMAPTSFCRYFKRIMKKTFFEYLKEFRIGYACRLLQETDFQISQVGYESGYNSISLFYKHFQEVKRTTPTDFRRGVSLRC